MEFRWAIIAALGVLMFGTLKGIVVAIIMSLMACPARPLPGVSSSAASAGADVLRPLSPEYPDDRDFRGSVDRAAGGTALLRQRAVMSSKSAHWSRSPSRACWRLDMSGCPIIEYPALEMLIER
jgi:hypothetical protein